MKYNKSIYLISFLLSLSFILLLEVSSLGLLAEDIKVSQKEVVEMELLLSASDALSEANSQRGETEEADKSSSAENEAKELEKNDHFVEEKEERKEKEVNEAAEEEIKTEKIQQENDLKTEETKEKVEEPKKETQKAANKEKPDKMKMADPDDTSSENKVVEEKRDEMPAWLKNSETEKDNSKKAGAENTEEEKEDKFDLESYLAELENDDSADQVREVNKKNDNKNDHNLTEKESETDGKNSENKTEEKKDTAADGDQQEVGENKVYDLRKDAKGIKKPGLKNYSQPGYPANLRKRNIEGEVIISLRIDKEGKTHNIRINKSSGYDSFDQAALESVSEWNFEAAEKDGNKVEVIVNLPIRFELN